MTTVAERAAPAGSSEAQLHSAGEDAVRQVSAIFRDFLRDLRAQISGRMNLLVPGDEDAVGADFAFCLEIPQADYEKTVRITAALEARYFQEFGINFLVIPNAV